MMSINMAIYADTKLQLFCRHGYFRLIFIDRLSIIEDLHFNYQYFTTFVAEMYNA
jgi:hypothetical protein